MAGEMENHPPVSQSFSDALANELDPGAVHEGPAGTGLVAVLAWACACSLVGVRLPQAPISTSSALKSGATVGASA